MLSSLELCAGAGGQALGLEQAGFHHAALVEVDPDCCRTLRANRPDWRVIERDLRAFDAREFRGVGLLAAGLPCPPFSIAGKQLGALDERNLFPEFFRILDECDPSAALIENVRGLLGPRFAEYLAWIQCCFEERGYTFDRMLLNAADFGVPQNRLRVALVAVKRQYASRFRWPLTGFERHVTVGDALRSLMAENGWRLADDWAHLAQGVAPALVGGSKKHGGPDLGPTRARQKWATLGVDGRGVAAEAPNPEFVGKPRLTVRMAARVQGFPDDWVFTGPRTNAYRQVGNAFPPPVAYAIGCHLRECLEGACIHAIR